MTKKNLKKEEILRVAALVFRTKGYHAARIQDIADALGMQKGSLYYYIKTKDELLSGLVEDILTKSVDLTKTISNTKLDTIDKLKRSIEAHLVLYHSNRDAFGVFLNEDIELISKASKKNVYKIIKDYEQSWKSIFEHGIKKGIFRKETDLNIMVKSILGMMNWSYKWYKSESRGGIPQLAESFSQVILNGCLNQNFNKTKTNEK
jgi:AcrR family transcriptional regulator